MAQKPLTLAQFLKLFPDDEACLVHLFEVRFGQGFECPRCERSAKWYRIEAERAYSCGFCGNHLHPTVGTPFHRTRTPLQSWFYAIFMFTTTRNGVAAKELERFLGVTYKTAWRMAFEIRKHMAAVDGEDMIGGIGSIVEVDETLVGGKTKGAGKYRDGKTYVMGMLERGGEVITKVVPNNRQSTLIPAIRESVAPGTEIHSDELKSYRILPKFGYPHRRVNHAAKVYCRDGVTTNTLESFWAQFKRAIHGTHIHVSQKYLWTYAKETEYRFNRRACAGVMFGELVSVFSPCAQQRAKPC
jgi:transposase